MPDSRSKINFPGSQGADLAARLDLPLGRPRAFALFAHCFTCSKESLAAVRISAALAERGIATLRFDFTGLGGSGGDFASTSFSSNVDDLVRAADWLRQNHEAPRILVGHSLGGAAVLAAASKVPESVAVATLGAPYQPGHVRHLLENAVPEIEARGEAEVSLGNRKFRIRRQFLDDIAALDSGDAIGNLRKALLVMHSPRDEVVGVDNAASIFVAAKHPKSFVSLDSADHLLTKRADAEYVGAVLAAWASRYLDETGRPVEDLPPGVVRVSEAGSGRYTQTIRVGRHTLVADEPAAAGGNDAGPSPYDLLLAGLGACTSMTLRMYAAQKQWPLDRVTVDLKHEKIHAADCETCETREGKVDSIERVVKVEGELDESQRRRLLEIANKCPVHRTLHSEIMVPTSLTD
jgi:putative redox protein